MTDIAVTDLTNATALGNGTGVFDKIMQTALLHIDGEYNDGRITGSDFASVYLGSLQTVLAQSVEFLLKEQAAGLQADLITAQIAEQTAATLRADKESEEKLDLIRGQTAKEYETIKFSQDKTTRDNLLNTKQIAKIVEEIYNVQADTTDKNYVTQVSRPGEAASVNSDIAIKAQQEYMLKDKNGGVLVTYTYYINGVDGATATTTDLSVVAGSVISTEITSATMGDGVSTTALDKLIIQNKSDLIEAQTLGFQSDTKQKVLKQMHDGYAVNLSIAGVGNVPESNQDAAIDQLAQNILDSIDPARTAVPVVIQSTAQVPATGETTVPALGA